MSNKILKAITIISPLLITASILISGCSSQNQEIGIGPVKEVKLGPVDPQLADKGQDIFQAKCTPCHRIDTRFLGPPLKGVTKQRKPEWIMNMILNPMQMTQDNKYARELFVQYPVQMTFQNVTQEDARAILEYLRYNDENTQSMK
jgi:mono/diheme cytochrome c family protein